MTQRWPLVWLAVIVAPSPAYAHSPLPGIEGFYIGLLHPFSTPAQALLILGTGLMTGGFGESVARWLLAAFGLATMAGLFLPDWWPDPDVVVFALAFGVCVLAALAPGRLLWIVAGLSVLGGLLIGGISVPDPGPPRDRAITMSGSILGASLGLLYLYGIVRWIRERYRWVWVGVALRIAAAWTGAITLVMLALRLAADDPELLEASLTTIR
ncbi:MAG: hypothetical protein AAGF79_17720 [Pseudomonadota bacterium]